MATIKKTTLSFLKDLKQHNDRPWFDEHRDEYEAAKKNILEFVDALIPLVASFDPEIAEVKSKDCLFRINRDTRFGKDKTPYKTHFGAVLCFKGRKSTYPSYYLHLEPGNVFYGGGAYMLMPEELHLIRQEIDYNTDAFLKILQDKKFKAVYGDLKGEALVKAPKGFEPSPEALPFVRQKQFYVMSSVLSDKEVLSDGFLKKVAADFKLMRPLNAFLQQAITP